MLRTVHCEIKLTVKTSVAHGVKADRLSVRWKDIPNVHCTDRVTVAINTTPQSVVASKARGGTAIYGLYRYVPL